MKAGEKISRAPAGKVGESYSEGAAPRKERKILEPMYDRNNHEGGERKTSRALAETVG